MRSESVCWNCVHCTSEDAFPGGPSIDECEEMMDQFIMPEGCYLYQERKEEE